MCIMLGYMVVTQFEVGGGIETNPAGIIENNAMLDEAHSQEYDGGNRHESDAAGVMNGANKVGMAGAGDSGGIWPINGLIHALATPASNTTTPLFQMTTTVAKS